MRKQSKRNRVRKIRSNYSEEIRQKSNNLFIGCLGGPYKAVIMQFDLPSCTYATMALRELTKMDTSSSYQATLTNSHSERKKAKVSVEGRNWFRLSMTWNCVKSSFLGSDKRIVISRTYFSDSQLWRNRENVWYIWRAAWTLRRADICAIADFQASGMIYRKCRICVVYPVDNIIMALIELPGEIQNFWFYKPCSFVVPPNESADGSTDLN